MHKCLSNKEPVLLVGETGCGKTTLCQVFAALNSQELFSINCHQNTETSDFIGCMRTRKNLQQLQENMDELLQQVFTTVEIDQDKKSQIQRASSSSGKATLLLKALKPLCKENLELRATFSKIKELKNELSMVFEW